MKTETAIPLDLSGLTDSAFEKVLPLLETLAVDPSPKPAQRVRGLLLSRAVRLLRGGSRREIHAEAREISRFLASAEGENLRQRGPEVFGGLSAIGRLLSGAARQMLPPAVDAVLLNYKEGRGRQLLELLARRGQAVPRSELRKELGLSESHLSHLLRELEEDVLILRYPAGKRKVLVDLTPTGRSVLGGLGLPDLASSGSRRPAADPATDDAGAHYVNEVSQREGWHFDKAMDRLGDRAAMSAYGPN